MHRRTETRVCKFSGHDLLNKTESAVFIYYSLSLFLKDPFSRLFRGRNSFHCLCVEWVKLLPVHRYSVDIFLIFWSFRNSVLAESRMSLKPVLGA